ncbi:MAG: aminotransferase class I/II-fold pyridoxal phosphate-dependent enzyme, partial [Actinomycetota bacterium]|nr:aminotransferase class I/II-fold pyridoxal phosphate-dependent enzyme [Actinomycetota bacterium]
FARVPGPSSQVAVLGEWMATGMQSIASSWGGGSGTATLEVVVLDWLRDALGLAPTSEGVLLSGGSIASTTGLLVARAENGEGVLYLSDQTHSSIGRGALAVGWPAERVRTLPTDALGALMPDVLEAAITSDLAEGDRPAVAVATAGTTNTGAVDDLPAFGEICRRHGLWLHVDGAYGGPAALAPDRNGIRGLECADSFVLDPHKWLFQPYDVGCLWVCEPGALERTFAMHPEYLRDAQGGRVDLHNRSLELTRRSRAAKLWLTLRTYGVDALAAAVQRGVALAEEAQRLVEREARLEVVTPARLGVLTFAVKGADDIVHAGVTEAVNADGYAAITGTVVGGRSVLRLCTINPRTTVADLEGTVSLVARVAGAGVAP